MIARQLWLGAALACILLQLISGACVCNEKGTDECAACSGNRIIRPKPKYHETNPDLNLPPVGDNCWCSKLLIEPAALPKASCPKVRETFEWLVAFHNLLRRRMLEMAIEAKRDCLGRLHRRLSKLDDIGAQWHYHAEPTLTT